MTDIDRSSWVTWACFSLGLVLAWSPDFEADLVEFGTGSRLMLAAIVAFFIAVVMIQRHMRIALTSSTFGEPQRMVTAGVFRWSRNPIYLAFLVPMASLAWFSPLAAVVASVVYLMAMTRFVIAREEADLRRLFGEEFADYAARTPRWLLV